MKSVSFLASVLFLCLFLQASVASAQPSVIEEPAAVEALETQDNGQLTPEEMAAWEEVAARAEDALESAFLANRELEALRAEVASWRSRLQTSQNANNRRIETLRGQVEALGPAPAEDQVEAPEIAERRRDLNERIARLTSPRIAAEEAFRRADGIVLEIDRLLRERQARALLRRDPAPVNPIYWPQALRRIQSVASALSDEIAGNLDRADLQEAALDATPIVAFWTLIGIVLLWRARRWTSAVRERVLLMEAGALRTIAVVPASLAQMLLPVAGVLALTNAARASGFAGPRLEEALDVLPLVGFVVFFAIWLGERLFSGTRHEQPIFAIDDNAHARGRALAFWSGLFLALTLLHGLLVEIATGVGGPLSRATEAVLTFPVVVLGSLLLLAVGRLARTISGVERHDVSLRARLVAFAGKALAVMGLLAPALAAAGYVEAAYTIVLPTILSLAIGGVVLVLQRLVGDLVRLLPSEREREGGGLVSALAALFVTTASLPALALAWGVRPAELVELWARVQAGIQLGETRIGLAEIAAFLTV